MTESDDMAGKFVSKFKPVIVQPSVKHKASVIFLHGSGSNGPDMKSWVKMCFLGQDMVEPHIRFIYPTAPSRPYTAADGMMSNVWFDRLEVSPSAPETDSVEDMCSHLTEMIDAEVKNGIPKSNIVLGSHGTMRVVLGIFVREWARSHLSGTAEGGFSMGGALSLYYGLQYGKELAGVFCLSSFLSHTSRAYKVLQSDMVSSNLPPVFQTHGQKDDIVPFEWGKTTNKRLSKLGVNTIFREYPSLFHQISTQEMKDLRQWLHQRLPYDDS